MAEQLKSVYSKAFYVAFSKVIQKFQSEFNATYFINQIFDTEWENKELKQRMRHTTLILNKHLLGGYEAQVDSILKMIPTLREEKIGRYGFEFMFLADFIEVYGLENYQTSINAIENITQFVSCEFAIRPFIIKYPEKLIPQLKQWSLHKSEHVRRLASEGSRPRLPWSMALPSFKKDPELILPILENLKNDPSEYVRRSVANNLNDISKDNPEIIINIAKNWKGMEKETNSLIKHACRTLLKQGNPEVMELFGFGNIENIEVSDFHVITPKVKIGEDLKFRFSIINKKMTVSKIRLEYGLYYQKANGTLSKKVFKISEKDYHKNSTTKISRKQSFKIITTRKYHLGKHQVSIIINGKEFEKQDFELIQE